MRISPFLPRQSHAPVSATSTSTSIDLKAGLTDYRIYNKGPNTVHIRVGVGSQTATTSDMPIPSGAAETFSMQPTDDTMAFVCANTETATVYVTQGLGA